MQEDKRAEKQNRISQCHQLGRNLLDSQTRAIDELVHDLAELDIENRAEIYVPILMVQSVGVSIHSVLALTRERDMGIRDCFGIARSAVETSVNAAFISVSGEPMAEKAVRHMRQKRWRDLRRHGRVGDQTITVSRDTGLQIDDLPGLREALEEYTNKKGDEVRDWTSESLDKRIAIVSGRHHRAGLLLGSAIFSIYRPASELLHGSYYGVNLFWQGSRSQPAKSREEFDGLWVTDHFVTLLSALLFATSGAIQAIAAVHQLPHHSQKQNEFLENVSALTEMLGEIDPDDDHHFQTERA